MKDDELTGNRSAETDSAYDQVSLRSIYVWQGAIQSKSWALIGPSHPDEVLVSCKKAGVVATIKEHFYNCTTRRAFGFRHMHCRAHKRRE